MHFPEKIRAVTIAHVAKYSEQCIWVLAVMIVKLNDFQIQRD